jgi:hypothetical protein
MCVHTITQSISEGGGIRMFGRRAKARAVMLAQADAERAETAERLRAALAAQINDAIVHTIGAQQAVVRGAYPDDILSRLQAAEESAREALTELGQLSDLIAAPTA